MLEHSTLPPEQTTPMLEQSCRLLLNVLNLLISCGFAAVKFVAMKSINVLE